LITKRKHNPLKRPANHSRTSGITRITALPITTADMDYPIPTLASSAAATVPTKTEPNPPPKEEERKLTPVAFHNTTSNQQERGSTEDNVLGMP